MHGQTLTFLGIIVVLAITPGADMALVMRNVLTGGFRSIWPTLAGIFSALTIHVAVCVAGLGLLLIRSDAAFTTIKVAGAAWLVWLGIQALVAARRHGAGAEGVQNGSGATPGATARPRHDAASLQPRRVRARTLWLGGFLTNLLNVKIALFYLAFLPQFAPAGDQFIPVALGLATLQAAVGFTWLVGYGLVISRASEALASDPRTRGLLERVTGVALIGFGIRLATAAR